MDIIPDCTKSAKQDYPTYRNWFLEVNPGADCYKDFPQRIAALDKVKGWAFVLHDKDTDTKTQEPIKPHYHAVIQFISEHHFGPMRKKFPGAHIRNQTFGSMSQMVHYLIHDVDNARNKYQYRPEDITTSDDSWLRKVYREGGTLMTQKLFMVDSIEEYIVCDNITTIAKFAREFGEQISNKVTLLKAILEEFRPEAIIALHRELNRRTQAPSDLGLIRIAKSQGSYYVTPTSGETSPYAITVDKLDRTAAEFFANYRRFDDFDWRCLQEWFNQYPETLRLCDIMEPDEVEKIVPFNETIERIKKEFEI